MSDDLPSDKAGRLPPGQSLTRKFPVVGEKEPVTAGFDLAAWHLEVGGLVGFPMRWGFESLMSLPQYEIEADIHCVTGWTRLGSRFKGLPLDGILKCSEPLPEAKFVRFVSSSPRAHDSSLPLDVARDDTWLVHSFEGSPLELEHGFPFRTLTPSRYFYKSVKWVQRIELLAEDRLGYWERESSYHNVGDPWPGDQRFTSGSLKPDQAERFRVADDFARFRGKVLLGLDLRSWRPASRDLRALELKSCDLREADLRGCDLRGANFSLSNLRGADLGGADLRGADLEGADFAGADLRGADLRDTALSATRFFADEPGGRVAAQVEGMAYQGASGLLEDQEDFLARAQASKA